MRIETEHRRHEVEAAREAQEATREAARELSDEDETRSPRSPRSLPLPLPLEQADHAGGAHAQLVEGGGYAECSGDEGEDRGEERNESEGEGEGEGEGEKASVASSEYVRIQISGSPVEAEGKAEAEAEGEAEGEAETETEAEAGAGTGAEAEAEVDADGDVDANGNNGQAGGDGDGDGQRNGDVIRADLPTPPRRHYKSSRSPAGVDAGAHRYASYPRRLSLSRAGLQPDMNAPPDHQRGVSEVSALSDTSDEWRAERVAMLSSPKQGRAGAAGAEAGASPRAEAGASPRHQHPQRDGSRDGDGVWVSDEEASRASIRIVKDLWLR